MGERRRELILIHVGWRDSLVSNASTLVTFVGMIGIGVYFDSTAMQWVGGIVFMLSLFGRASTISGKNRMTVAKARKRLDEIEAEFHPKQEKE